ncbi:SGNH/GDSL hydrolase family protein [Actinomadura sp. ATCC 31491]|uniref:SGNH/GDSL hydrolase family protein n=1 Tax=Actinomadura luzonensis TaxID=2805427 RepID=A0ABT0FX37_9ACTN|nr:SGNH/GDSL hydrolase family protein [Actinomadura luzonensis]MCK2216510.1 SGNH/GDSL hydrolase family protein [Actinomadura luzonensis]
MSGHWVDTWTAMPQRAEPADLPPAPYGGGGGRPVLAGATLRQTVRVSAGGPRLRLRLSNAFGGAPLPVTRLTVALPAGGRAGGSAIEPGTSRPVTFSGRPSVVAPPGAQAVSDPVDLPLAPASVVTVTIHLAEGQRSAAVTAHPGSRTTSHLAPGDQCDAAELTGATPVDHWYLLGAAEVWAGPDTSALVLLGDSLTDGRGSTTNGNDRWPDQLYDRLLDRLGEAAPAIANQAAGGNRVLADGLGPSALARLDRDVLARSGARWLIVFEGVNDLGTAGAAPAAQKRAAADLIAGYEQIVTRAHAGGLIVYGATLTPFGGNDYDDPDGSREAARQAVNDWIRAGGRFDAVLDFDRAVRDPAEPRRLRAAFDVGDGLHLSPAGYAALAAAVPAELFTR